jgi:hypothetical protein
MIQWEDNEKKGKRAGENNKDQKRESMIDRLINRSSVRGRGGVLLSSYDNYSMFTICTSTRYDEQNKRKKQACKIIYTIKV